MPNGATRAQRADGTAMTDEEWTEYVQILRHPLRAFASKIARLSTDEDMPGDYACSMLSKLIEQARTLTRDDSNADKKPGVPVIVRTCNAYADVLKALAKVRSFVQRLGDTTDEAQAMDLLTNYLEEVEDTINGALRKAGIP